MLMGGEETGSYEVCISHYLGDINCPSNNITAQPLLLLLDSLQFTCCLLWQMVDMFSRYQASFLLIQKFFKNYFLKDF